MVSAKFSLITDAMDIENHILRYPICDIPYIGVMLLILSVRGVHYCQFQYYKWSAIINILNLYFGEVLKFWIIFISFLCTINCSYIFFYQICCFFLNLVLSSLSFVCYQHHFSSCWPSLYCPFSQLCVFIMMSYKRGMNFKKSDILFTSLVN